MKQLHRGLNDGYSFVKILLQLKEQEGQVKRLLVTTIHNQTDRRVLLGSKPLSFS